MCGTSNKTTKLFLMAQKDDQRIGGSSQSYNLGICVFCDHYKPPVGLNGISNNGVSTLSLTGGKFHQNK